MSLIISDNFFFQKNSLWDRASFLVVLSPRAVIILLLHMMVVRFATCYWGGLVLYIDVGARVMLLVESDREWSLLYVLFIIFLFVGLYRFYLAFGLAFF